MLKPGRAYDERKEPQSASSVPTIPVRRVTQDIQAVPSPFLSSILGMAGLGRLSSIIELDRTMGKAMDYKDFKLPKEQRLRQTSERDCGIPVFAALAGVPEAEVRRGLPEAHLGTVTVDGWTRWLEQKGFKVEKQEGCPGDIVPCAHLVALVDRLDCYHWIYRDGDGDIHDPSPGSLAMPADDPQMKNLCLYKYKIFTLSLSRQHFQKAR